MRTGVSKVVGSLSVLVVVGAMWVGVRPPASPPAPSELLYLQTRHGITALDTRSGSTALHARPARRPPATGRACSWPARSAAGRRSCAASTRRPGGRRRACRSSGATRCARSPARATPRCSYRPSRARTTSRPARRPAVPARRQGHDRARRRPLRRQRCRGISTSRATSSPRRSRPTASTIFALDYRPALSPDRYRVRRVDVGERHRQRRALERQGGARRHAGRRAHPGPLARRAAPLHALHRPGRPAACVRARAQPRRPDRRTASTCPFHSGGTRGRWRSRRRSTARTSTSPTPPTACSPTSTRTFLAVDRVAKIPVAKSSARRPCSDGPVSITATPGVGVRRPRVADHAGVAA